MQSTSSAPAYLPVAAEHAAATSELRTLIDDTRIRADAFIFLSGGASKMSDAHKQQLLTLLETTLANLANGGLRFAVADGGTQAGIMQAAGLARHASGNAFPLIGVAPAAEITRTNEDKKTPIDPNHSSIVAVSTANGGSWGSETETMYWLFAQLAAGRPSVTLVANGGEITLDEIKANVAANRAMVLIAGSGRATDALVSLLTHTATEDPDLKPFRESAERRGLPGKPALFHVVDLQAGSDALTHELTRLLSNKPQPAIH